VNSIDPTGGKRVTAYGVRYRVTGDHYDRVAVIGHAPGPEVPRDMLLASAADMKRRSRVKYAVPVQRVEVRWPDESLPSDAWPTYLGPWTPVVCCDAHGRGCQAGASCCQFCSEALRHRAGVSG
jgi:hypothetical protein